MFVGTLALTAATKEMLNEVLHMEERSRLIDFTLQYVISIYFVLDPFNALPPSIQPNTASYIGYWQTTLANNQH